MAKQPTKNSASEIGYVKSQTVEFGNLKNRKETTETNVDNADHYMRLRLSIVLGVISVVWLVFTAFVIIALATRPGWFSLSDPVAIAFLTQSLGTVLGLWGIGLKYYFKK